MAKMAKTKVNTLQKNQLLLLSAGVLILVNIMSFGSIPTTETRVLSKQIAAETVVPVLQKGAKRPELSARSIFAIDLDSGKTLFSKDPDEPLLPASTTKIATALVSLAHYNLDDVLTVPKMKVDGQTMDLVEGEKISVRNLLYGMLVFSANDAAEVLARSYPGGRDNFLLAMNELTKLYDLDKTHFVNPAGFDEYLHFSTARDLAKLAFEAMRNPIFAQIVGTPKTEVASEDSQVVHKLVNINELVGKIDGVLGVKTGWTINSGGSLITMVDREGHKIILSVLGSEDRFGETEKLIDWLYANYSWGSS
ncbi:MAG: serine hydrolase [bacterium]|nr:serine hydrolase [bacterium]